jgi:hypothetical protein
MICDGYLGVAENYNSRVFIGSIEDGNGIEVTARIQDGIIEDVRFRSFGCKSLLASAVRLVSDIRGMPVSEAKIAFQNSRVQSKGIFSGCFVDKDFILSRLFSHETHILPSRRVILCQCKQLQRDEIENRILVDNLLTYSDVARVFDLNPSCLVCRKRIIKILKRVIEAEQVIRYGVSDYEG